LSLGYKKSTKGLRRFDEIVCGQALHEDLIIKIIETYPEFSSEIKRELSSYLREIDRQEKLEAMKEEEIARKNFRPWIYVETHQTRPSPAFVAIFTGFKSKIIKLSEQESISIEKVRECIVNHYARNKRGVIAFGPISGYRYCDTYDSSILFSVTGEILQKDNTHFEFPFSGSYMKIDNKKVSDGLFKKMGLSIEDPGLN